MTFATSGFEGEVDRILGSTLRRYGLVFDGVFDGTDEGGRSLSICYFRGPNCKLQVYRWEREGETNCMIAPADAPNEFGLLSTSKKWQFLTRFVSRPDYPLDEVVRSARAEFDSYAEPLKWVRARINAYYEVACTAILAMNGPEPDVGEFVVKVPLSGADAVYRGTRYRILFSSHDWVALRVDPETEIPDALERGASGRREIRTYETWTKVPRSALEEIIRVRVTGVIAGQPVWIRSQNHDGRIGVEFIGRPELARQLGMKEDQYMGWTGLFAPEDFENIHVEETRGD